MKSPIYYHVAPRYSGGSPAQVDFDTATKVCDDEKRGYDISIHGGYGAEYAVRAQTIGLAGIVEERTEKSDCWLVTDMLTGAKFIRMFTEPWGQAKTADEVSRRILRKIDRLEAKYRLRVRSSGVQR